MASSSYDSDKKETDNLNDTFYSYSEDSDNGIEQLQQASGALPVPEDAEKSKSADNDVPPEVREWDPMASDYMAPNNLPTNDPAEFDYVDDEYKSNGNVRLCKFFRYNGMCARGINCRFRHIQTGSGITI